MNIATRAGVNTWHGEAYEFFRNNDLDAELLQSDPHDGCGRDVPNPESPFKRNQFGGDGGGAMSKDKTFIFLTYEGLRQRQAVPLSLRPCRLRSVAQAQSHVATRLFGVCCR